MHRAPLLVMACLLSACALQVDEQEASNLAPASYVDTEEPENYEDARVGEAASAVIVTRGALCEYSCAGAAAAGCAAVALACTAGTVWTFGGISIPCQYAVVAACYAIGAGGVACTKLCE